MFVINIFVYDYMNWCELLCFCYRILSSLLIMGNKFVLFFVYSIVFGKWCLKSVVEFMLVCEVRIWYYEKIVKVRRLYVVVIVKK